LAEGGLQAFDAATRRIYAAGPPRWDGTWTMALQGQAARNRLEDRITGLQEHGFVEVSAGTWMRPEIAGAAPLPDLPASVTILTAHASAGQDTMASHWPLDDIGNAYR